MKEIMHRSSFMEQETSVLSAKKALRGCAKVCFLMESNQLLLAVESIKRTRS